MTKKESTRIRTTTQTVRHQGKRIKIVTRNGRVTIKPAMPEEWELQAAQIRALRGLPEYAATEREAGRGRFTIAGDQNAARRGPKARTQALAAGLTAGEHDVRVYMWPVWSQEGGILGLIENKVGKANLEPSQKARHPLLAALGFKRQAVIRSTDPDDAATQAVALVRGWLAAANDNATQQATQQATSALKAAGE